MEECKEEKCTWYSKEDRDNCNLFDDINECYYITTLTAQKEPVADVPCDEGVIKPCPFCGGEALINTYSNMYETVWSISCTGEKDSDCAGLEGSGFRDDREELVRQWNKRAL